MAVATSLRCSVRRLNSCAALHDRMVSSWMKNSQARANSTGASALIMRTSSSLFMIWAHSAAGEGAARGQAKKAARCCTELSCLAGWVDRH